MDDSLWEIPVLKPGLHVEQNTRIKLQCPLCSHQHQQRNCLEYVGVKKDSDTVLCYTMQETTPEIAFSFPGYCLKSC